MGTLTISLILLSSGSGRPSSNLVPLLLPATRSDLLLLGRALLIVLLGPFGFDLLLPAARSRSLLLAFLDLRISSALLVTGGFAILDLLESVLNHLFEGLYAGRTVVVGSLLPVDLITTEYVSLSATSWR